MSPSNALYIKKMLCHPCCYESHSTRWVPCCTRVTVGTGSKAVPLSTTSSTWTTSSYMPRMSRTLTHWYISLGCLVPTSAWHLVWQKCGRLIVNRGKVKSTCGISLPEGQIDDIDESYKYLGILQSFGNNDEEVRCKATSEYRNRGGFWRASSLAKTRWQQSTLSLSLSSDTQRQ